MKTPAALGLLIDSMMMRMIVRMKGVRHATC